MKRFLFVISDTGGGHRASARAVRDEIKRLYGDDASIELADIFVEIERWPFYNFPRWYPSMVKFDSVPWGWGYHLTDHAAVMKTASHLVWPYVGPALKRFLRRHPADLIASFHAVPNYALVKAVRQMHLQAPVVTVVLDLVTVHAGWFVPGALSCFVPTEEAKQRALQWDIPPDRLEVMGGMPVRRDFVEAQAVSKTEARVRLGLPCDLPIVLMVGGGEGMGPLEEVIAAVGMQRPQAHLVAIAGRNQDLYERLCHLDLPVPLHVEGFVSNMEIWMRAADLLVTKGGPNTLSEAFIAGIPVVIYSVLHGQEEGNVDYVVNHHAGVWAPEPEQVAEAVCSLLANTARRDSMAVCARRLANPAAAELLAKRLWSLSQEKSAFSRETSVSATARSGVARL
jgi:1,2-diacylglycerol 3-beta-galactosyltransferase